LVNTINDFLLISITNLVYKELFVPSSNLFTLLPILINIFLFISFLKKKAYYPWCQITVSSLAIVDEIITMVMFYYHQLSNTTEPIKDNIIIAVIIAKALPAALIMRISFKIKACQKYAYTLMGIKIPHLDAGYKT